MQNNLILEAKNDALPSVLNRVFNELIYINKIILSNDNVDELLDQISINDKIAIDRMSNFFASLWDIASDPSLTGNRGKGNMIEYILSGHINPKLKPTAFYSEFEECDIAIGNIGISLKFYYKSKNQNITINFESYPQKIKTYLEKYSLEKFKQQYKQLYKKYKKQFDQFFASSTKSKIFLNFYDIFRDNEIKNDVTRLIVETTNPNIYDLIIFYNGEQGWQNDIKKMSLEFHLISPSKMRDFRSDISRVKFNKYIFLMTSNEIEQISDKYTFINFNELNKAIESQKTSAAKKYLIQKIEMGSLTFRKTGSFKSTSNLIIHTNKQILKILKNQTEKNNGVFLLSQKISLLVYFFNDFFYGIRKQFSYLKTFVDNIFEAIKANKLYSFEIIKNKIQKIKDKLSYIEEIMTNFKITEQILNEIPNKGNQELPDSLKKFTSDLIFYFNNNRREFEFIEQNIFNIRGSMAVVKKITDNFANQIISQMETVIDKFSGLMQKFKGFTLESKIDYDNYSKINGGKNMKNKMNKIQLRIKDIFEKTLNEGYYQKLLTKELIKKFPPIGATENKDPKDIPVIAKFFTPWSKWTWYATEFDGKDLFFGYIVGEDNALGYFSLSELESIKGPYGLKVERDMYFKNKTLADVMAEHE